MSEKNLTKDSKGIEMISFIQHDLPGLNAGDYKINVEHTIEKDSLSKSFTTESEFHVLGDRFTISNPGNTIYSTFPADNATGKYSESLPHIVFKKSPYPWMRSPKAPNSGTKNDEQSENGTDPDVPIWMALLLFDQDELDAKTQILKPDVVTLKDLFPNRLVRKSSLGENYSYFDHLAEGDPDPESKLGIGAKFTDPVNVIDIDLKFFTSIAPSIKDLGVMGHVRKVSLLKKATMKGVSDVGKEEAKFSIVFGNRLPSSNKKNTVFLVSLEGLGEFLDNGNNFVTDKNIRLAVLKRWSFFATEEKVKLTDILCHLNNSTEQNYAKINEGGDLITTLRYPPTPPPTQENETYNIVKNMLSKGYVPLNHDLRVSTDKTVSWYRGPLVPHMIENRLNHWIGESNKPWAYSADELLVYDPVMGMLDPSCSVAWRLGKQLVLKDKKITDLISAWTNNLCRGVREKAEMKILEKRITRPKPGEEDKVLEKNELDDAVSFLVLNEK